MRVLFEGENRIAVRESRRKDQTIIRRTKEQIGSTFEVMFPQSKTVSVKLSKLLNVLVLTQGI